MYRHSKKVCYFTDTLNPNSGWGRLSSEVINRIALHEEFRTEVLVRIPSGTKNEKAVLESGFFGIIRSVIRSRRVVRQGDIIHAFDGWPNAVVAALANIFLKKKFFITAVGTYSVLPLDRFGQGLLLRFAYRRAEKIFAISNYTKDEILKRIFLKNIEVVNLGVDFEKFHRAYAAPESKKNILLSVGEIKQRKGYHVALEAFFILKKKFPDLKYIIAGGGNNSSSEYYRYLCGLIEKNRAWDSVEFRGDVTEEELLGLYGKAKIFLLPSINAEGAFEGFGLVILEANAAGIPAVGTTPSGMDDIIVDGKNGFLVPSNNDAGLSSAIEKLLLSQDLYKKISERALEVARKMSWKKTAQDYQKAYEQN